MNAELTSTHGTGIDNIPAMTIHGSGGTTNYYYLKDLANTVLALANSSGSIVESYDYDAYGNVTIRNGSGTVIPVSAYGNRFLFLGREYDYTTQLHHFRARWYDPETGRWLVNDPIGISGGLNLYAFCANNPVCFVDPMGLSWDVVAAYVSGFAEGAIGGAAVMLDGAIPFAGPFSCAYTDSCGSVDSAYGPSLFCSDVANAAIPFGPGKLRRPSVGLRQLERMY